MVSNKLSDALEKFLLEVLTNPHARYSADEQMTAASIAARLAGA